MKNTITLIIHSAWQKNRVKEISYWIIFYLVSLFIRHNTLFIFARIQHSYFAVDKQKT